MIDREAIEQAVDDATRRITEHLGKTLLTPNPVPVSSATPTSSVRPEASRSHATARDATPKGSLKAWPFSTPTASASNRRTTIVCDHPDTYYDDQGERCRSCREHIR